MTRTEADLRAVLVARADRAPDVASVLAGLEPPPTPPSRRRRFVLAGALIAVLAIAGSVAGAVWLRGGSGPQFSGGVSAHTTSHTRSSMTSFAMDVLGLPTTFRAVRHSITATTETLDVVVTNVYSEAGRAASGLELYAVAYAAGSFDPATVQTGTPVTINGTSGWFGPARGFVRAVDGMESSPLTPSIAWQRAPGLWVVVHDVTPGKDPRTLPLALARAMRFGRVPVRLPATIGYVPAPLAVTAITIDGQPGAIVQFAGGGRELTVTVGAVDHQSIRAIFGSDKAPLRVAGHPAKLQTLSSDKVDGYLLTLVLDDYVVTIGGNTRVTTDELRDVAEHLTYAKDSSHTTAWFLVKNALP